MFGQRVGAKVVGAKVVGAKVVGSRCKVRLFTKTLAPTFALVVEVGKANYIGSVLETHVKYV